MQFSPPFFSPECVTCNNFSPPPHCFEMKGEEQGVQGGERQKLWQHQSRLFPSGCGDEGGGSGHAFTIHNVIPGLACQPCVCLFAASYWRCWGGLDRWGKVTEFGLRLPLVYSFRCHHLLESGQQYIQTTGGRIRGVAFWIHLASACLKALWYRTIMRTMQKDDQLNVTLLVQTAAHVSGDILQKRDETVKSLVHSYSFSPVGCLGLFLSLLPLIPTKGVKNRLRQETL